ncbi:unnamed protein product [Pedinophyceae sp. YPF-701]|nr:unnamed protein product [Pedinophyceae sp. YPF-701]
MAAAAAERLGKVLEEKDIKPGALEQALLAMADELEASANATTAKAAELAAADGGGAQAAPASDLGGVQRATDLLKDIEANFEMVAKVERLASENSGLREQARGAEARARAAEAVVERMKQERRELERQAFDLQIKVAGLERQLALERGVAAENPYADAAKAAEDAVAAADAATGEAGGVYSPGVLEELLGAIRTLQVRVATIEATASAANSAANTPKKEEAAQRASAPPPAAPRPLEVAAEVAAEGVSEWGVETGGWRSPVRDYQATLEMRRVRQDLNASLGEMQATVQGIHDAAVSRQLKLPPPPAWAEAPRPAPPPAPQPAARPLDATAQYATGAPQDTSTITHPPPPPPAYLPSATPGSPLRLVPEIQSVGASVTAATDELLRRATGSPARSGGSPAPRRWPGPDGAPNPYRYDPSTIAGAAYVPASPGRGAMLPWEATAAANAVLRSPVRSPGSMLDQSYLRQAYHAAP